MYAPSSISENHGGVFDVKNELLIKRGCIMRGDYNKKCNIWFMLLLLCGLAAAGSFRIEAVAAYDAYYGKKQVFADHYNMDVTLDADKDHLSEDIEIHITNHLDNDVDKLYFRNMATSVINYDKVNYPSKENKKKNSSITKVTDGNDKEFNVNYRKDKSVFYIDISDNVLKSGESMVVKLHAETDIPLRDDRFGCHKSKYGKIYMLSFCFPYLAANEEGKWDKDPYFDDGESRAGEVTDYSVRFTAPSNYTVAASGNEKTENGVTTIEAEKMRDFAIVACDHMNKESFTVSGVTVNNYYLPGKYQKRYRKISKMVASDAIRLYTDQIGKYAYDELDMLPCPFGYAYGGMEYPGLVMNNVTAYYGKGTYTATFDPCSLQEVVAHEIGHQWFYAAVGNDEYREGWLDEGFTTYLEKVVYGLESTKSMRYVCSHEDPKLNFKKIKKEYNSMIKDANKVKKARYVNIPVNKYPKKLSYGDREYDGGCMFLCELKLTMGSDKFSKFIKDYYSSYTYKKATTADVVKLVRKYSNSKKVNRVINKYVSKKYL